MRYFSNRVLPSLCILLLLTPSVIQAAPSGQEDHVYIRLLCYQHRAGLRAGFLYHPNGEPVGKKGNEVKLPLYQLTDPILVKGRNILVLPNAFTGDAKDFAKEKPISRIVLPRSGKHFIVIFFPSRAGGKYIYQTVSPAAPPEKFRGGSYYLLNTTKTPLAGMFGSKKVKLPANKMQLIDERSAAGKGSVGLVIRQWSNESRTWSKKPVVSIPVNPSPRRRELLFFFSKPGSNKILWRGVVDLLPAR